jgi:septum site-determining protein MinC
MRLQALTSPRGIQVRGRNLMALVLTPEPPLAAWIGELDAHLASAGAFETRPVIVDLARAGDEGRELVLILLEGLEARGLRIVGVERAAPVLVAGTVWERMADPLPGRNVAPATPPAPPPRPLARLVEGPVRSGQTLVFETGDVTVVGAIASGAEVVAGGSIHVYGALRGRAIAGLQAQADARIFCTRLEAEMIGIGRHYRTAEHWGPGLHGRPVQVWLDRETLRLSRLDRA